MPSRPTTPHPQVTTFVGAEYAYACIRSPTRSLDVRLNPGCSAKKSLLTSAAELREQAQKLLDRADFIEAATLAL